MLYFTPRNTLLESHQQLVCKVIIFIRDWPPTSRAGGRGKELGRRDIDSI